MMGTNERWFAPHINISVEELVPPDHFYRHLEDQPMRDLIFRTRFRWKLRPRYLTGDTKYGTIDNIKVLEEAGIACDASACLNTGCQGVPSGKSVLVISQKMSTLFPDAVASGLVTPLPATL